MGIFDKARGVAQSKPGRVVLGAGTAGLSEFLMPGGGVFGSLSNSIFGGASRRNAELDRLIAEVDPGEKPAAAEWIGLLNKETGRLADPYQLGLAGTAYGDVLQKYRQEAYRPGAEKSDYENALQAQLDQNQQQLMDQAITSSAARNAEARSSLAGKRGLSGAAAERLAQGAQRGLNRDLQQVRAQGAQQGLGIRADELARRQGMFEKLAGIEGDVETKNIQGALSEVGSERQKKQSDYEEQMRAWAAGKQAQATLGAAKGGKK